MTAARGLGQSRITPQYAKLQPHFLDRTSPNCFKHARSHAMPYHGTKPLSRLEADRLSQKPKQLFYFVFKRNPGPLNVANHAPTSDIAGWWSRHPYHIRTLRRLEKFDPTKLHWKVAAPLDISKSGYVRDKAAKRVRQAITDELRARGWGPDGRRLPVRSDGKVPDLDLSGAVNVMLVKESYAVTATIAQVRAQAKGLVRKIVQAQTGEPQLNHLRKDARDTRSDTSQHWRSHHADESQPKRHSPDASGEGGLRPMMPSQPHLREPQQRRPSRNSDDSIKAVRYGP